MKSVRADKIKAQAKAPLYLPANFDEQLEQTKDSLRLRAPTDFLQFGQSSDIEP